MNNKGFTVIELLASFTLTMIITVFLFQVVLELKDIYWGTNIKTRVLDTNAIVATTLNNYFKTSCDDGTACLAGAVEINDNTIKIGSKIISMPEKTKIATDERVKNIAKSLADTTNGADNRMHQIRYKVTSQYLEKPIYFNFVYTYRVTSGGTPIEEPPSSEEPSVEDTIPAICSSGFLGTGWTLCINDISDRSTWESPTCPSGYSPVNPFYDCMGTGEDLTCFSECSKR